MKNAPILMLLLFACLNVAPLACAGVDDAGFAKPSNRASSSWKKGKKQHRKVKNTVKQESEDTKIAIIENASLWKKMKQIQVGPLSIQAVPMPDVVEMINFFAGRRGEVLEVKYLAGEASESQPRKTVNLVSNKISLADLLHSSCKQTGCTYLIEEDAVKVYAPDYFERKNAPISDAVMD